jgi:hypothetical protein
VRQSISVADGAARGSEVAFQVGAFKPRSSRRVRLLATVPLAVALACLGVTKADSPKVPTSAAAGSSAGSAAAAQNPAAPEPAPEPLGEPVPAKILRYAERLVQQYDANGDGVLQKDEWQKVRGSPDRIDANRDGLISVNEFAQYIYRYGQSIANAPAMPTPAAAEDASDRVVHRAPRLPQKFHVSRASLPPGLPEWFTTRDADGDGQITMPEFAPSPSRADVVEFNRFDRNHDGVITAEELVGPGKPAGKGAGRSKR